MKFNQNTKRSPNDYEKDLVQYWKKNNIFEESINFRSKENSYIFYDGPPFISGVPHHGTLLSGLVKDSVARYWTMKGKRVERVWGWDCHGLPAERYTEKKLGLNSRQDVIDYGIEKYIIACRDNMVKTADLWEEVVERSGRWVDMKNAYKTMDKNYMESVWWAFKKLYEKGKIYEGEKVLMYCTLDATPLSKAEVTMDTGSYQEVTDPSIYVKFRLEDNTTLLVWTTTPWTLPANTALAVNEELTYVEIDLQGEKFILAKERLDQVLIDEKHQPLKYEIIKEYKGRDLVGRKYKPLLDNKLNKTEAVERSKYEIYAADYVSNEDGTGIVHIAPAYGEEDFELAKQYNIPVVHTIDENGNFTTGDWKNKNVWDVNKQIAKDLKERGVVWRIDYIRHSYPHCHRCGTRLMYKAHPSWFMDIDGQRELMLEQNGNIDWFPPSIKNGRFVKNIEQAPDWNLSRDRFWATAMPVWKGIDRDGKERVKVIGSYSELKELSGVELDDYHRPWVDDISFKIDDIEYRRIDKVMDCWFESGSMPFAQFHYPFENKDKFEENYPGDFIVEYVGQVRAWFYYLHAVNVGLFGSHAFKNVVVTGNVAGNDGRKMSKSFNNFTEPTELMDKYSADSLRFLLLSSPLLNGEDYSLQDKNVADVYRKLNMVWNMFAFFTLYADVDRWEWDGKTEDPYPFLNNILDKWIVARIHQLLKVVDKNMEVYNIPVAIKDILPFIDDASNWYIRRSRKRFWKSDNDLDKQRAYQVLHYILVQLSYVLAPFTPFLAEELFIKLTNEKSIHLKNWPEIGHIDELLIDNMAKTRNIVTIGLNQRANSGIKVRQPLAKVTIGTLDDIEQDYLNIIKDELNVKDIDVVNRDNYVELDTTLTESLKLEGLARDIIRQVQEARKHSGLSVDDRINLKLNSNDRELSESLAEHSEIIYSETLAVGDSIDNQDNNHKYIVKIDGNELHIVLSKAKYNK